MRPAVVVTSFRTPERIRTCLDAIGADDPDVPVYLADNASDPVRLAAIARDYPWVVMLGSDANRGFAAAVNRGAGRAFADGASHALLLNDDVYLRLGAIGRLAAAAGDRDVAAPYLDGPPGAGFRGGAIDWGTGIAGHRDGARDYLCGACLMVSREAWRATGGFDESYFLYYEDVDWSVRAAAAGARLNVVPEVLGWHDGGSSTGGATHPTAVYYWTRSRIRFVRRHRGYVRAAAVVARSVLGAGSHGTGEPDADRDAPAARATPVDWARQRARVKGLVAGFAPW